MHENKAEMFREMQGNKGVAVSKKFYTRNDAKTNQVERGWLMMSAGMMGENALK